MIILVTVAVAPALALFSFFYLRNQLATEPRNLLQTFIFGAALTFPILFVQYVLKEEHIFSSPIIQDVFFTGTIEELFKWLLLFLFIYKNVQFDDPYDGILYGAAISLGFATVENVLYLVSYGVNEALLRALLPVSGHALFGVVMGYYFGRAKFSAKANEKKWLAVALLAPVSLHIIFNLVVGLPGNYVYIIIPFMIFLWWFALQKVKRAYEQLVQMLQQKNK